MVNKGNRRDNFLEGIAPIKRLPKVEVIPIDQLVRDARLQQRAELDEVVVRDYASRMVGRNTKKMVIDQGGEVWPEVKAINDGERIWVYDGFQRLEAAELAELKSFQALVEDGDFRTAWQRSLTVNLRGKKRLTNADKRKIVKAYLTDEEYGGWADAYIASEVLVSHEMVRQMRGHLIEEGIVKWRGKLLTRDGKMIPAGKPVEKKKRASNVQLDEPTIRKNSATSPSSSPQPLRAKDETKGQNKENSFDPVDNQTSNPQDETELPYNPVDITPPKAEPKNEVTQEPVVYGNPGNWLMRDAMKKSDWTSLAGLLTKKQAQTFIAPAPHQSPHMSDPLQWVAKYTGALAGRVFKQVIIVGRKVYFVWSSNDLELPTVFDSEEHLSTVLEAART